MVVMMTKERDSENRVLSGRRALLKISLAVIPLGLSERTQAQSKIAQNMVQYQDQPKGDAECDKCAQFIAPGSCVVVDGKISPRGWCVAFAPKAPAK